jgi:serine/threonine protein kinase
MKQSSSLNTGIVMATRWNVGDYIKGRWEVIDSFKGGMGLIYIVYDHNPEFNEIFAVKTFNREKLKDKSGIDKRFFEEMQAWVSLDVHENIVSARTVEEIEGQFYLFLEYIDGPNLESYIGMPRLSDLSLVARFSLNVCDGMNHALSKGIKAHRDIKPSNCLIDQFETLKLTDFGLAKVDKDPEVLRAKKLNPRKYTGFTTQTGERWGTVPYMPPEQFDDFSSVDLRGDIYSFGVMLFQMLTGELPFDASSDQEFEQLHKNAPIPQLTDKHIVFNKVVETCLAKNPDHRCQDFEILRRELAEIYTKLTGQEAPIPAQGPELDLRQLVNKGASFFTLKIYDEALRYTDRAIRLKPDLQKAHCNKGAILDSMGRTDEAMESLNKALILNPRDDKSWINKAIALRKIGKQKEAFNSFRTARSLRKDISDYWYYEGLMFREMGLYSDAIPIFRRCVSLNSLDKDAWALLGVCYRWIGNDAKADECYLRADQLLGGNSHLSRILKLRKELLD